LNLPDFHKYSGQSLILLTSLNLNNSEKKCSGVLEFPAVFNEILTKKKSRGILRRDDDFSKFYVQSPSENYKA